jgi:hypothetical protein
VTTLHSINFEPSIQEKAIWGLNHINPGEYTTTIRSDGTVHWVHTRSENEGILDLDYFVREYDSYHSMGYR